MKKVTSQCAGVLCEAHHSSMDRRLYFRHKCRQCSYMFVTERDLLLHEASHEHSVTLPLCGDTEVSSLKDGVSCNEIHQTGAIEQRRVCKACGEVFDTVNELYKHYLDQHLQRASTGVHVAGEPMIDNLRTCDACGASFACWASLKVHAWKSHGGLLQQMPAFVRDRKRNNGSCTGIRESASPTRTYRCEASAAGYTSEKPFKCTMCNWAFKYDFSLQSHLKIHEQKRIELFALLKASGSTLVNDEAVDDNNAVDKASCAEPPPPVKKTVVYLRVKRSHPNLGDETVDDDLLAKGKKFRAGAVTQQEVVENHVVNTKPADNFDASATDVRMTFGNSRSESAALGSDVKNVGVDVESIFEGVSDEEDDRQKYVCKMCNFTCRYDFSYIAHLSQHDKLKELETVDIQSHVVAATVDSSQNAVQDVELNSDLVFDGLVLSRVNDEPNSDGKFMIRMMSESGDVTYLHAAPVSGVNGVNYILLTSGDGESSEIQVDKENDAGLQEVITSFEYQTDDVVTISEESSRLEVVDALVLPKTSFEEVEEESVGISMLDSADGDTFYIVPGRNFTTELYPSSNPAKAASEILNDVGSVVQCCVQPNAGYGNDDDELVGETETMTCYFCNERFVCKLSLHNHMVQMHVID